MDDIDYKGISENLQKGLPTCCVINTSDVNEEGEHWVALHVTGKGHCEYFDSYGLPAI